MSQDHGGIDFATVQAQGLNAYDFSANVNPWGHSPLVNETLALLKHQYYPDPRCTQLRAVIAAHEQTTHDEILCGNGATELIWALCRWAASNASALNASVAVAAPTFGEYAAAATRSRLVIHQYTSAQEHTYRLNATDFAAFLYRCKPGMTFVCSPNNPTGQVLTAAEVQLIQEAAEPGYVVLDQAYREYEATPAVQNASRLLRLCSLTKAYGLAGLRLGYLLGRPETLVAIGSEIPPWTISSSAQAAGIAALSDQAWLARTLGLRREATDFLRELLREAAFDITSEGAGFFLVRTSNASQWQRRLYGRGLAVRDCTSFGLPDHIRISAGPTGACRRLVLAMQEVRQELC